MTRLIAGCLRFFTFNQCFESAGLIRATLASGTGEDVSEGPAYEPNEKSSSETYPPVSALYACEENHGCESATGPIQNTPQTLKDFLHPLPRFVTQPVTPSKKIGPALDAERDRSLRGPSAVARLMALAKYKLILTRTLQLARIHRSPHCLKFAVLLARRIISM